MVIPNVKVLMDGHPVLAYSYNIFYNDADDEAEMVTGNKIIIEDKLSNPNYYGCVTFDDPERLFSYTPDGTRELTHNELEEIIERIKHYRDNPALWNHFDD